MATEIKHKRSNTPGAVPTLQEGEIALNLADKRVFTANSTEVFDALQATSSNLTVTNAQVVVANSSQILYEDPAATEDYVFTSNVTPGELRLSRTLTYAEDATPEDLYVENTAIIVSSVNNTISMTKSVTGNNTDVIEVSIEGLIINSVNETSSSNSVATFNKQGITANNNSPDGSQSFELTIGTGFLMSNTDGSNTLSVSAGFIGHRHVQQFEDVFGTPGDDRSRTATVNATVIYHASSNNYVPESGAGIQDSKTVEISHHNDVDNIPGIKLNDSVQAFTDGVADGDPLVKTSELTTEALRFVIDGTTVASISGDEVYLANSTVEFALVLPTLEDQSSGKVLKADGSWGDAAGDATESVGGEGALQIANSTNGFTGDNAALKFVGGSVVVGDNVSLSTIQLDVGNTTVNTQHSATGITVRGGGSTLVVNSTKVDVGNTTVNTYVTQNGMNSINGNFTYASNASSVRLADSSDGLAINLIGVDDFALIHYFPNGTSVGSNYGTYGANGFFEGPTYWAGYNFRTWIGLEYKERSNSGIANTQDRFFANVTSAGLYKNNYNIPVSGAGTSNEHWAIFKMGTGGEGGQPALAVGYNDATYNNETPTGSTNASANLIPTALKFMSGGTTHATYGNNSINLGSNVTLTTELLNIGNSTVNALFSQTGILVRGASSAQQLKANSTALEISNGTVLSNYSFNGWLVSSNVGANQTHVYVGNSTVNATVNSTAINFDSTPSGSLFRGRMNPISFSFYDAALTVNSFMTASNVYIGNTTANATYNWANATFRSATATLYVSSAALNVGNSTVNSTVNSTAVVVGGVQVYSNLPIDSKSAAYTTVLGDANRCLYHPASDNNPRTFTIANNSSVAYPVGTRLTFVNYINTVTIAITTDTMRLSPGGTTGNRTLANNGVATAIKVDSTNWIISGSGLT